MKKSKLGKYKETWQQLKDVQGLFSEQDRLKLLRITILQIFLGILDLIGVALVGVISALAVNGMQSKLPGDRVNQVLVVTGLSQYSFRTQIIVLGVSVIFFFIGRTVISIVVTKKVLNFLALRGAGISSEIILRLYSQELPKVSKLNIQETSYRITNGVNALMLGVVGTTIAFLADATLLLVMLIGLIFVDVTVALGTLIFFSSIGYILFLLLNKRARNLGQREYDLTIKTFEKINQLSRSYRELSVHNQRQILIGEASEIRFEASSVAARSAFMPSMSKYIMEASLIVGIMAISASQFFAQDNSRAISILAIFIAAGSRIAPAILRLQQGGLILKNSHAIASSVLILLEDTKEVAQLQSVSTVFCDSHPGFIPTIQISNLSYKFFDSGDSILQDINLDIPAGKKVALVGPSGSGKTTLIDLLLGVRFLHSGQIRISGLTPDEAVKTWPGAISYVPQEVEIYAGTVRQNVLLGFKGRTFDDKEILKALETAQMKNFVLELPEGLDSEIGERGARLSGGQKQRIGIARAVLTNPKMIIFDEATSSLDGEIESQVMKALLTLGSGVTVIVIAHRLASIMKMDQVIYLADSRVAATGTFEEVRKSVPDFDNQAVLMGLQGSDEPRV